MRHNAFTRILSMILAICTVISMSTVALATEPAEPEVPAETIVETTPVETEPVETEPVETEPVETKPIEEVPVETEPVETEPIPDVTLPIGGKEPENPDEVIIEAPKDVVIDGIGKDTKLEKEEVALPYGLKGLPKGYRLSEAAMADKAALTEFGVVALVSDSESEVKFAEDQIIVQAADKAEAQIFAEAFNGTLKSFKHGMAVITLSGVAVADVVSLSAEMDVALPAAYPDEIVSLYPQEAELEDSADMVSAASLPERQSWESWVLENMTNPDTYLQDPTGETLNYQWHHEVIDTFAAWGITTGESHVKVAVLDTGVNANHYELAGRVSSYAVDSYYGTKDADGHGTHVAGLIAGAMDNGLGGAGVAPGVSIINVKVLGDDGTGYTSDIIDGIYTAVDKGAWIINMSLGGYVYNSSYEAAVKYAYNNNVSVIAAMGNDSSNIKSYPAAYSKYVIAVGASDSANERAFFSNWGSWIDVSAPGHNMWSSYYSSNTMFAKMSGTSQATPVVAGVAALYMSANGWVSPSALEKALEDSCVKGGSNLGKGIVNAANMFSKTKPTVGYAVTDRGGMITYEGKTVPCDAWLELWGYPIADETGIVLYTIDGKTPSVKNGEIVNGIEYTGTIPLEEYAGKSITVRAVAVNGLGLAGSSKTIKLSVAKSPDVEKVTLEGPTKLVAGKSGTYTAKIQPEKAVQSVKWSIVDREGMTSAKISSSGKLTTSSKQEGWVIIRATSTADAGKYAELKVYAEKIKPVSTITLSAKSATLKLSGAAADASIQLSITKLADSSKNPLDPAAVGIKWTSSKASVATVDQNGNVVAVAPGSATITAAAQDGSGKKATCKVTVKQLVEGIAVVGYPTMAPGASATYKATCYPTNASSKSVTWSLQGAPEGAKISSSGKVTLPKSATAYMGRSFMVVATAKDGSGAFGSTYVTIQPKCTGLSIDYTDLDSRLVKTNSSGYVSSLVLYTFDKEYYSGNDETVQLYAIGKTAFPAVKWTSSKPTVATVDENGFVVAKSAGTAKITAAAQDGSGKKATVTITVRNPVSAISIKSSALRSRGDEGYLAFGKSATNSAVFSDTYGTPSNKAVTWSFGVYEVNSNIEIVANYTSYLKNQGWIKMDSKGKLSTSSKIKDLWLNLSGELVVLVTATSVDDPSVSGSMMYFLTRPADRMYAEITSGYMYRNQEAGVDVYCNTWRPWGDYYAYELTATSSNPDIVGAVAVVPYTTANWYQVQFISGNKTGTATITVKAGDGSGKSCKIKIQVR